MQPELEIYSQTERLYQAAAERISQILELQLRSKEIATFVLTGGNTPKPVYEFLVTAPQRSRLDWDRIHFFWGDERCVPPDHPDSNFGMAWKALLSRINVTPSHIHRITSEFQNSEIAAFDYEREIRKVLPGSGIPSFDLVLLGMGEDGHTASLFPGTEWNEERLVVVNYVQKLDAKRITMTPRLLNEARTIIFLLVGRRKAKALSGVLEDSTSDYPAKRIRPSKGRLIWMIDSSAASLLKSSSRQITE